MVLLAIRHCKDFKVGCLVFIAFSGDRQEGGRRTQRHISLAITQLAWVGGALRPAVVEPGRPGNLGGGSSSSGGVSLVGEPPGLTRGG